MFMSYYRGRVIRTEGRTPWGLELVAYYTARANWAME